MGNSGRRYVVRQVLVVKKFVIGVVAAEELKAVGEEIVAHLREVVGVPSFVCVYQNVRQEVKERQEGRRKAAKIAALVDPQKTAKRKLRMSAKRQVQKKRKIAAFKRARGHMEEE